MTWKDTQDNFDHVEWRHMHWLKSELPAYLDFHEKDAGHLPQNFVDKTSGASLKESDPRFDAINRIGFWNYAVLINLILTKRASEEAPESFDSMLDLYDHTGRFFLRSGAAIDIAEWLAGAVEQDWDARGGFMPYQIGPKKKGKKRSVYKVLKKTINTVDAYNNGMKHNGLPAVKVATGKPEFLIPANFTAKQRGWGDQTPKKEYVQVLKDGLPTVTKAFNCFFETLAKDTSNRLTRWNLKTKGAPKGIVAVKGAMSGSHDVLDGYQVISVKKLLKLP